MAKVTVPLSLFADPVEVDDSELDNLVKQGLLDPAERERLKNDGPIEEPATPEPEPAAAKGAAKPKEN